MTKETARANIRHGMIVYKMLVVGERIGVAKIVISKIKSNIL